MTDERLLDLALRGGETEWEELHKLCLDRGTAERLCRVLERSTTQAVDVAAAWAGVLAEIHPGLKVNWPPLTSAQSRAGKANETGENRILKILCAEDHEQICELLKKVLSEAGHEVECVFDGQAAWERLSADLSAFDVLITDHQMPRLSGLGLVQRLRETPFAGRIVVESGNLTPELEEAFRALRVDRIVHKPIRPGFITELIAALR
jgi:two-component system chemotaxis response regulator CheY